MSIFLGFGDFDLVFDFVGGGVYLTFFALGGDSMGLLNDLLSSDLSVITFSCVFYTTSGGVLVASGGVSITGFLFLATGVGVSTEIGVSATTEDVSTIT